MVSALFLLLASCFVGDLNPEWLPCGKGNTCTKDFRCYYVKDLGGNFCLANSRGNPLASSLEAGGEEKVVDSGMETLPPDSGTSPEQQEMNSVEKGSPEVSDGGAPIDQ